MEQIIIRVKDKTKSKMLIEILRTMSFVDIVSTGKETETPEKKNVQAEKDFFALVGLWEGREIKLDAIRKKAWPRLQ